MKRNPPVNGAFTVTEADPDTAAVVAEIVAGPFATAATIPVSVTVATFASEVSHVNAFPAITPPFASRAVAANWTVSPIAASAASAGTTATDATVGGGGGPVVESPPQDQCIGMVASASTSTTRVSRDQNDVELNMINLSAGPPRV